MAGRGNLTYHVNERNGNIDWKTNDEDDDEDCVTDH